MHLRILILLLFVVAFTSLDTVAQCAMCKATAESSMDGADQSIGKGLNSGIIYLMIAPYVLLLSIGFLFFRKKIARFYKALSHSY